MVKLRLTLRAAIQRAPAPPIPAKPGASQRVDRAAGGVFQFLLLKKRILSEIVASATGSR